jgi:ATP dependent DNA ligase domain
VSVRTMAVLPRLVRPMLATLRRRLPADQDRYGWEFKWDGVRAVAYVSGDEAGLVSRNDKQMAASYPELAVLASRVQAPVILDGEIVALREGRPHFRAGLEQIFVTTYEEPLARRLGSSSRAGSESSTCGRSTWAEGCGAARAASSLPAGAQQAADGIS